MSSVVLPLSASHLSKALPLPVQRPFPQAMGPIHFVGIGGIGMSGIAEILHNLGYAVQGSDASASYNTERLEKQGVKVFIGHEGAHVDQAAVVVISSAVKADNPEVVAARTRRVPIVRRAEMLAELMRLKLCVAVAGTHGKTTTTSLTSVILEAGGLAPTTINGGIINSYGTNARLGSGEWMVVEADESDGTFIRLPSTVAIITNIDPEHLDFYGNFDAVRAAFLQFIEKLPFYGVGVVCLDHPEVQQLMAKVQDRRLISYGTSPQAQVRATEIKQDADGQRFRVLVAPEAIGRALEDAPLAMDIFLPMHGLHNVRNSLAAIAVGLALQITPEAIARGLASFEGVKRRFTKTGEVNEVLVIDDYGHHPAEISATLGSARQVANARGGKVVAVVQPHRYTRLHSLFEDFCTCFNDADAVVVADVYAAGESPIEGADKQGLADGLRRAGHRQVVELPDPADLPRIVAELAQPKDIVVCLGAGTITKWAYALPEGLESVYKNSK